MKSVKIGFSIFLFGLMAFGPTFYIMSTRTSVSGYYHYFLLIMNVNNFFIFAFVDQPFREWLKQLLVKKKEQE